MIFSVHSKPFLMGMAVEASLILKYWWSIELVSHSHLRGHEGHMVKYECLRCCIFQQGMILVGTVCNCLLIVDGREHGQDLMRFALWICHVVEVDLVFSEMEFLLMLLLYGEIV